LIALGVISRRKKEEGRGKKEEGNKSRSRAGAGFVSKLSVGCHNCWYSPALATD